MMQLLAASLALAVVVQRGVAALRNALRAVEPPSWVWMLLALALGVVGTTVVEFDVSSIPARAPDWVVRVTVGLFAGALSGGVHEGFETVRSLRHRADAQTAVASVTAVALPPDATVIERTVTAKKPSRVRSKGTRGGD